ncbi:MAG: helicase associated domain-containing protein, partial [Flammeovirgaceae bacterium]
YIYNLSKFPAIYQLNEIGFDWNFTPTKRGLITWYKRYAELEEFCLKNGHCEVPRSKTKKVDPWQLGRISKVILS